MKINQRARNGILLPVTLMGLLVSSPLIRADDQALVKPMALRGIMQEMSRNMQAITDAMAREAWSEVVDIAPLIVDHPQPPMMEKIRILSFFAGRTGEFKKHDSATGEAALELQQAAARQDGEAAISAFATLQQRCLACHQTFRRSFTEHFYSQK